MGREIAAFVGIDLDNPKDPDHKVPSEMAFTHFRNRIGPAVYEAAFHIEAWATFRGCENAG